MATDTPPPPRRHYWQLPTFVAGVAAAAGAYFYAPPASADPAAAFAATVHRLQMALDKKVDPAGFDALAGPVVDAVDQFPAHAGAAHYAVGTAYLRQAELAPADAAGWKKAADHFAFVDPAHLPAADGPRLDYRRAKCVAATGAGEPKQLIAALSAPPLGEDDLERHRLLGDAYMRATPPDPAHARDEWTKYLTGANRLPAAAAARYRVKLADVHLALREPDKARLALTDLGPSAPADVRALADVRLGHLAAAAANWPEAVRLFDQAAKGDLLPPAEKAAVQYHAGMASLRQSNPAAAKAYFEQAAASPGPTGVAAAVRLAENVLRDPALVGKRAAAVESLRAVVAAVPAGGEFQNPLVTVEEVRAAFEEAITAATAEADHATAAAAAEAYQAVAVAGRAAEKKADVLNGWAAHLALAPDTAAKAAGTFKEAAAGYAELAQTAATPAARADLLRRASKAFRRAGDPAAAADALDRMTQLQGLPDDILTAAWVERADGLRAENKFGEAVQVLRQAVDKSPAPAAGTRLKLAVAHLDQAKAKATAVGADLKAEVKAEIDGMTQLATDLLDEVTKLPAEAAADKDAQQQALFELGKLHLQAGDPARAEDRFRKLVQTHPAGPVADQARLYLGSTLLLLARGDHMGGRPPANADAHLAEAAKLFEGLGTSADDYLRTQADIRLVNTTLLLRKYDEMPALAEKVGQKYAGKVEELIVLSMAYTASRLADRPAQAAEAFAKMDELFAKLPAAAYTPAGPEEYRQEFWKQWLTQLKPPAKK